MTRNSSSEIRAEVLPSPRMASRRSSLPISCESLSNSSSGVFFIVSLYPRMRRLTQNPTINLPAGSVKLSCRSLPSWEFPQPSHNRGNFKALASTIREDSSMKSRSRETNLRRKSLCSANFLHLRGLTPLPHQQSISLQP